MPSGVNLGTGNSPLFLIFLSSFSMLKSFITSSTWRRMSAMYGLYTLYTFTVLSFDSSDFFSSSIKISPYRIHSWMYCLYLFSISSMSMQSAGAASFLIWGSFLIPLCTSHYFLDRFVVFLITALGRILPVGMECLCLLMR